MDGSRFDLLTKAVSSQSRRSLLKAAVGTVLGGALANIGRGDAAAALRRPGEICRKNGDCVTGVCGPRDRTGRQYCQCVTAADCPQPANGDQCHVAACNAGVCSLPVTVGATCDDGNSCTANDVCQANGVCAGTTTNTVACTTQQGGTGICCNGACLDYNTADQSTPCCAGDATCGSDVCLDCNSNGAGSCQPDGTVCCAGTSNICPPDTTCCGTDQCCVNATTTCNTGLGVCESNARTVTITFSPTGDARFCLVNVHLDGFGPNSTYTVAMESSRLPGNTNRIAERSFQATTDANGDATNSPYSFLNQNRAIKATVGTVTSGDVPVSCPTA